MTRACRGFAAQFTAQFTALSALLGAAGPAAGGDLWLDPAAFESNAPVVPPAWTFSLTPYIWLVGLDGHATVRGRTTDINADPFNVLDHLTDLPWMSYGEARLGRFGLYGDIVYAPLGTDAGATRTFGRATLDATLGVDVEQTIAEFGAVYEVAGWRSASMIGYGSGFTTLDVLAGARYWRQDVEVRLAVTATLDLGGLALSGNRAIARSGDVEWVDPLVGLRLRHQLARGHELVLRGDVGGFDAGSTFSWNVLAAYSWQFATRAGVAYSGVIGYRALAVDFEKGSGAGRYEYDTVQQGPLFGLTASF